MNSIKTLEAHNNWRRGGDAEMCNPTLLGLAIEDCVKAAKRYELVRTLNVQQFKNLYKLNLAGANFDAMVDEMVRGK